jgi:retron-type reverse transcriptase
MPRPGVDGMTWEEYGNDLEEKVKDLHDRIHRGAYSTATVPEEMDPEGGRKTAAFGHRSAGGQNRTAEVLNQIWEMDFLGFSYGFRPGRKQHDALDALSVGIVRKKVNSVLDADIRGFFDNIDHEWMVRFVEHRIATGAWSA